MAERLRALLRERGARAWIFPALVALVVGGVVSFEVSSSSHRRVSMNDPRYLVAKRDLQGGQMIHFLDYSIRFQHEIDTPLAADALTDQDWHRISRHRLRRSLREGEVLTQDNLVAEGRSRLGTSVPLGLRAYAFSVASSARLVSGDRVDILLNPRNEGQAPLTLLEGISVLEVERDEQGNRLVAALSNGQIEVLEKGRQIGELTTALRNPQELPTKIKRGGLRQRRRGAAIQVFSEGE